MEHFESNFFNLKTQIININHVEMKIHLFDNLLTKQIIQTQKMYFIYEIYFHNEPNKCN